MALDRDSPQYVEILRRQNARIGTWPQRALAKLVLVYLLGAPMVLLSRLLFRVRVVHGERYDALGSHAILALRHFYEWDPALTYLCLGLFRSLSKPNPALTISSELWARTAPRRAFSWLLGILPIVPNHEPEGALARSLELLSNRRKTFVAICPTGPIGASRSYHVGYSVGYLAVQRPELPVVPVSVVGVQDLRWSRVWTLRRPRITIVVGQPIYGSEVGDGSSAARQKRICDRIDAAWREMEAGLG